MAEFQHLRLLFRQVPEPLLLKQRHIERYINARLVRLIVVRAPERQIGVYDRYCSQIAWRFS